MRRGFGFSLIEYVRRIEKYRFPQNIGMEYEKIYVEVIVRFLRKGGMRPLFLVWSDGRRYAVDRVKFIERAPSRVASILPVRYTCMIGGREKRLYYEEEGERWFVERERL